MTRWLALGAAAALSASPVCASTLAGEARAIDGDSLSVGAFQVRLFGIDAPEGKQTCNREGQDWPCGEAAAGKLQSMVEGKQVICRSKGNDTYGRTLAVCEAGGVELNRTLVAYGWAVAFREYSQDYVADETRAKSARSGIWSGEFDLPSDWRAARTPQFRTPTSPPQAGSARPASVAAPYGNGRCAIKGNRNRRGQWIYHLPGMPYYEQTRPEEIFCSEAAAQAAGYRRAIIR